MLEQNDIVLFYPIIQSNRAAANGILYSRQCYHSLMRRSGFVLVGGSSSRMGRDKALLPYRGERLVDHIAREVRDAAGSVTLVGAAERYGSLGYRAISDKIAGRGPLGGVHAALSDTAAEWNLVVACDMPRLERALLEGLLERAEQQGCDCLVPLPAPHKVEPLCAVWRRSALAKIEAALNGGVLRMTDVLQLLDTHYWTGAAAWFANANTPRDWVRHA
jgi:molybdopterin-guanine dinucleotide biosynthesis protein A